MAPTTIAIIIDVTTLYIVKNSPNRLYVANIESTPVIGVDIRKLVICSTISPLPMYESLPYGITVARSRGVAGLHIEWLVQFEPISISPRCLLYNVLWDNLVQLTLPSSTP